MKDAEFNKRMLLYKKYYTTEVTPECEDCYEVATIYDTLSGENYCEICLKKSLMETIEVFKEYTDKHIED